MPSQNSQPTKQCVFDMQLCTSCATNPSAPDMPKLKHSTAEVAVEKTVKEDDKAAKTAHHQATIQKVAALENMMMAADAKANLIANHPPTSNKEKITCKLVAVKDKEGTNKSILPAATQAGKQSPVPNQDVSSTTDNNEGNAHQSQIKLDEKKGKQPTKKMGVRDNINMQRQALISVELVSAGLLLNCPMISKRKASASSTGDSNKASDVPSKTKKVQAIQGSVADHNALVSSASVSSISMYTSLAESLTANTKSDAISTLTVSGTPGEDNAGLVLWGRPSINTFGEGDDTQEQQSAIAKKSKSTVYLHCTAAKALSSVKIMLLPMMGLAPHGS